MKIKAEAVFKVLEYAVILICGITKFYKDEHADKKEKQPTFTNRQRDAAPISCLLNYNLKLTARQLNELEN